MIVAYLFFASRYIGAVITIRKIGPPTASHSSSHTTRVHDTKTKIQRGISDSPNLFNDEM